MVPVRTDALVKKLEAVLLAEPPHVTRILIGADITIETTPAARGRNVEIKINVPDHLPISVTERPQ